MAKRNVGATSEDEKVVKKTKTLPFKDAEIRDLAITIIPHWRGSGLNLLWISVADFEVKAQEFATELKTRTDEGGSRSPLVKRLKDLDKKINAHISYIKTYLVAQYGKENASSYYVQFGLERKRSSYTNNSNGTEQSKTSYQLPTDRNLRLTALQQTVQAMQQHGFTSQTYGYTFWNDIYTEYEQLTRGIVDSASAISSAVSNKNRCREMIVKTLNALLSLLKANYPDDYKAMYRTWGFQKEKY